MTAITPLPSLDRTSATFKSDVDTFLATQLPTFSVEANAAAVAMNLNSTNDTSTTSNAIGLGAKTFTVTAGKSFQPGMYLVIADTAAPSNNSMAGQVTSYNTGTGSLVMSITSINGSGTKTAWTISQSTPVGTENTSNKDVSGGYAGLTLFKINFKNALNTFTSFFTNSNTASRTYTFPDKSIIICGMDDVHGPNLLINNNFQVNQLVKTGTVTLADGQHGHDGFFGIGGGCTYTFSKSNNITTITITSGYLAQKVNPVKINSGNIILNWGGTSYGKIDSWPLTGLLPSAGPISKLVTGGDSLACVWGVGTLFLPKLEPGYTPTSSKCNSFEEDLFQCLPYCQKSYDQALVPGTAIGNSGEFGFGVTSVSATNAGSKWSHAFNPPMHAVPVLTLYSNGTGASGVIRAIGPNTDVTPTVSISASTFTIDVLTGATTTDNRFSGHFLAEARL